MLKSVATFWQPYLPEILRHNEVFSIIVKEIYLQIIRNIIMKFLTKINAKHANKMSKKVLEEKTLNFGLKL